MRGSKAWTGGQAWWQEMELTTSSQGKGREALSNLNTCSATPHEIEPARFHVGTIVCAFAICGDETMTLHSAGRWASSTDDFMLKRMWGDSGENEKTFITTQQQ